MRNSAWPSYMRIACCRAARAVKGSELREEESGTAAASPHRGGFGDVSHVYFAKWEVLNLVPLQDCTCDHKRPPGLADSTERRHSDSAPRPLQVPSQGAGRTTRELALGSVTHSLTRARASPR